MILLKEQQPKHYRNSFIHTSHEPQQNKENNRVREKAKVNPIKIITNRVTEGESLTGN